MERSFRLQNLQTLFGVSQSPRKEVGKSAAEHYEILGWAITRSLIARDGGMKY